MNLLWISIVLWAAYGYVESNGKCIPACQASLQCCDTTCFDNSKQTCCNGVVHARVGTLTQCCGKQVFDFSKQICCGGIIHDKSDQLTFCCGNATYSPKTNQCCNQVVSPLGTCSQFKMHQSLKVMNTQCSPACQAGYECCNGICYDNTKQMCCDGTLQNRVGSLPQCCGKKPLDFSKQICCGGVIHDKSDQLTFCCGNVTYSPKINQCCNQTVSALGTCSNNRAYNTFKASSTTQCNPTCQTGYECCKSTCYDTQHQVCCDGIIKNKVGSNPQCCDTEVIDYNKQVCCNGTPQDRLNGITFCCGTLAYSPVSNSCCNETIVSKGSCAPQI